MIRSLHEAVHGNLKSAILKLLRKSGVSGALLNTDCACSGLQRRQLLSTVGDSRILRTNDEYGFAAVVSRCNIQINTVSQYFSGRRPMTTTTVILFLT